MDNYKIDPAILASLQEEEAFSEHRSKGRDLRVQIQKGQTWILRYLPSQLGPAKTWYARIARHWGLGKPITCPRDTSKHFGGDPEIQCPICDVAAEINASEDERISNLGWKASAQVQWLTYCLVFEKEQEVIRGDARWQVWTHWQYQTSFDRLSSLFKKHLRNRELSIFDWDKGYDVYAYASKRGLQMDLDESPTPLTKDPEKLESIINLVWSRIKNPDVKLLDQAALETAADRLKAISLGRKSKSSRNGFDESDEEEEPRGRRRTEEDDEPRGRRRTEDDEPAPRSRRPERDPEPDPEPAPRAPRSAQAPPPRSRAPEEPAEEAPEPETARAPRSAPPARSAAEEAPSAPRASPPPSGRASPPPASRPSLPPARSAAPRTVPPRVPDGEDEMPEGDETVPPETTDPAPPAEKVDASDESLPPPAVAAPRTKSVLTDRMKRGIAGLQNR